jgi:hypothetical protein
MMAAAKKKTLPPWMMPKKGMPAAKGKAGAKGKAAPKKKGK